MDEIEVIVNLWYIVDEPLGLIYRLMGRAYVASGSEESKIVLLKALSRTDYLAAQSFPVPKRFKVHNGSETMEGYCRATVLDSGGYGLFEQVFEHLDSIMPPQASFENGEPTVFKMKLPPDPLCVTTALLEDENGVIRVQT